MDDLQFLLVIGLIGASVGLVSCFLAESLVAAQPRAEACWERSRDCAEAAAVTSHGIFPFLRPVLPGIRQMCLFAAGGAAIALILSISRRPSPFADLIFLGLLAILATADIRNRWLPDEADHLLLLSPLLLLTPLAQAGPGPGGMEGVMLAFGMGAGGALLICIASSLILALTRWTWPVPIGKADICAIGAIFAWHHDSLSVLIDTSTIIIFSLSVPVLIQTLFTNAERAGSAEKDDWGGKGRASLAGSSLPARLLPGTLARAKHLEVPFLPLAFLVSLLTMVWPATGTADGLLSGVAILQDGALAAAGAPGAAGHSFPGDHSWPAMTDLFGQQEG